ncbi:MAG TPA: glutathione S-transferase family protein [Lysobacter sp.]
MTRVLYTGTKNASSWALRAWLALREQGIAFEERVVDIRVPQRFENLDRIRAFSPPGAVPVLVDGDAVIFDSLAIMEYASEIGPQPLWPADPVLRARARSLLAWVHGGLSNLCARLSFESAFYADKRAMTQQEIADSDRLCAVWERTLAQSGGPYLFGELSLADLAFVPVVCRIVSHRPTLEGWPLSQAWCARLLERPAVREWLDEARTLPVVVLDDYHAQAQRG